MGGPVLKGRFPRRWTALTIVRNVFRALFESAARGWSRNLAAIAPALGSMTLLLLLGGLAGLTWYGLHTLADREVTDAAVLHVYLRDDAGQSQVDALRHRLSSDGRVRSVGYTSKTQALAQAQNRPGLSDLARDSDQNPFPASLDLRLRSVSDVGGVAGRVRGDPAVDPVQPTSFDPGAYGRLQTAMTWLGLASGAILAVLALVAVMVTANSVRSAIHSRREEVSIMQLVGAPRWMVRGPFVVEGAITGATAGLVAGAAVLLVAIAVIGAGAERLAPVFPGLTPAGALLAAALVLVVGVLLGSVSSLFGIRRHLEA